MALIFDLRFAIFLLAMLASAYAEPARAGDHITDYPCRLSEPSRSPSEPNPTVRDAVTKFEMRDNGQLYATAQACIVVAPGQPVQPERNLAIPPEGLGFDWNLALVGPDGALVDVFGTLAHTGPILSTSKTSPKVSLDADWSLGDNQPTPAPDRLFAQIKVDPCTNLTSGCAPDDRRQSYVTVLMQRQPAHPLQSTSPAGASPQSQPCLASMPPGVEIQLRQPTVIAHDGWYRVFACLASTQFESFALASFDVKLLAGDGSEVATGLGGNTRENIGPLFPRGSTLPQTVALLAVDIPAVTPTAPASVVTADITFKYTGCSQPDSTDANHCLPPKTVTLPKYPVTFEQSGP